MHLKAKEDGIMEEEEYKNLGDLSAVEPWHRVAMCCHDCKLEWSGCWDNFQCPKCGKGELPYDKGSDKVIIEKLN